MRVRILLCLLIFLLPGHACAQTKMTVLQSHNDVLLHSLLAYGVGIGVLSFGFELIRAIVFNAKRKERRRYYNEDYLKSDEWKRKRYVVLRRDNWTCAYCGHRATQVHHTRYARRNIGREPIDWLVSVCENCHAKQHGR